MTVWELLLIALVGWTAIGIVGVVVASMRREWLRVRKGLIWLVGVWVAYLAVLVATSLLQPQRVVAMGQDQCYDEMCFAVMGVEEVAAVPGADRRGGWKPAGEGDCSGYEQGAREDGE